MVAEMVRLDEKPFRAKQLWHWIYFRGSIRFADMTTLSAALKEKLAATFVIARPTTVTEQLSADGTRKWLLRTGTAMRWSLFISPRKVGGALHF